MKKIISSALALCLCFCLAAPAFADEADKAETVYIEADAEGNVRSVTVETVLNYSGNGTFIEDVSSLTDIKNTEGDEDFVQDASGALLWDDHGEKIRYEGKTDRALPIAVHVSYYLNGARISPDELAGKGGHVRIRFDYENLTSDTVTVTHPAKDDDGEPETEQVETCIPLLAITLAMLPEDVFRNIEVENGRLMTLGSGSAVLGYALPGLTERLSLGDYELTEDADIPTYVVFEADTDDFSLDFTATIVTNGLLEDLEPEDLDDLDEMTYGMDKLTEASEKLADGARELSDGAAEFSDYIAQYTDGARELADGARTLSDGLAAAAAQKDALLGGANALQAGIESLEGAFSAMTVPDTSEAADALQDILADMSAFGELLSQLQSELSGFTAYAQAVETAVAAADSRLAAIDLDVSTAIGALALTDEQKQQVSAALAGVVSAAESDIAAARGSLADVPAAPESPDVTEYAASVAALAADLAAKAEALQAAAAALPDVLLQTVSGLAGGSAQLTAGLSAFLDGVGALSDGAAALSTGAGALSGSGSSLKSAAGSLADGADALADGMEEFDDEGISELSDLADENLFTLATELRAMREADIAYDNFGGIADGRTGSVRFIIETDEIG